MIQNNIQKSAEFPYTNKEAPERKIKENNSSHNGIKKNKTLRYKLTKYVKDVHTENYKTLTKKLKSQINRKILHTHALEEYR